MHWREGQTLKRRLRRTRTAKLLSAPEAPIALRSPYNDHRPVQLRYVRNVFLTLKTSASIGRGEIRRQLLKVIACKKGASLGR